MLNAFIRFALKQRLLVVAAAVFMIAYGTWQSTQMEIDVFPNLNRPRVVVITEAHGMAPEEVEALITIPLESALNGADGVIAVRTSSGVGVSVITVEFEWGTDIYNDRQIVTERLALAQERLPPGVQPTLAPISSILGQIVMMGMWSHENEKTQIASIGLQWMSTLDNGEIPVALRKAINRQPLKVRGGELTKSATLKVDKFSTRWLLHDPELNKLYAIRKQSDGKQLEVHKLTTDLELRTLADWVVRQRLLTISGISQVFNMGGGRKQFQVLVDPDALQREGVSLHQVKNAVEQSNKNSTGGYLDKQGANEFLVRVLGRAEKSEDLEKLVIEHRKERSVLLKHVARVVEGSQVKRGDSSAAIRKNGSFSGGSAVVLTINKQPGADTRAITERIEAAVDDLRASLPPDVHIEPGIYAQRQFIDRAVYNVVEALADGGVLVVVLLFLFLLNFRTTFITLTAIPLSLVFTALIFSAMGVSINTMTLGGLAVAIGELVDDAIVDVENIFRRLNLNRELDNPKNPLLVVFQASVEIRNSIVFGTMIVVLVFLPLFALEGMEGRLFAPLGLAYIVSILASLAVSLTLTPVLSYLLLTRNTLWRFVAPLLAFGIAASIFFWVLPKFAAPLGMPWLDVTAPTISLGVSLPLVADELSARLVWTLLATPVVWVLILFTDRSIDAESEGFILRGLKWFAGGAIRVSLAFPGVMLLLAAVAVMIAALVVLRLERDLLPPFDEGAVQLTVVLPPGTSLQTSNEIGRQVENRLKQFDFVDGYVRRTGRAELDEHAEGVNTSEIIIHIDPHTAKSRNEVIDELRQAMKDVPGVNVTVEQPLAHLMAHMLSGVKAQVAIKLYGDDLNILRRKAREIEAAIRPIDGVKDLLVEPQVTIRQLRIRVNRDRLAFYGLTPGAINEYVETAMNGEVVSQVLINQRTFDLLVRFDDRYRENLPALRRLVIDLPAGQGPVAASKPGHHTPASRGGRHKSRGKIKLEDVADIYYSGGPNTINREQVRRRIVVQCNVADRGLVDVVQEIQAKLEPIQKSLPTGYYIEYGGQFESQQRATRRIVILFIIALIGVFLVLYTMFRSVNFSLQVMVALPMAFIGSVAALVYTNQTLTVAAMVGFISLGGIASRNGILLLNHYLHLVKYEGESWTKEMMVRAGQERLAPVLMTALTSGIGLLPLALAAGESGKEVLYPVATVIIGGLLSSTLLEFIVRPALFWTFGRNTGRRLVRESEQDVPLVTEEQETQRTS